MPPCDGAPCGATLNIKRGIAAPFIYLLSRRWATPRHCHHKYFKTFFYSPSSRPVQINSILSSTDSWTARVAQNEWWGKKNSICSAVFNWPDMQRKRNAQSTTIYGRAKASCWCKRRSAITTFSWLKLRQLLEGGCSVCSCPPRHPIRSVFISSLQTEPDAESIPSCISSPASVFRCCGSRADFPSACSASASRWTVAAWSDAMPLQNLSRVCVFRQFCLFYWRAKLSLEKWGLWG